MKKIQIISLTIIVVLSTHLHLKAVLVNCQPIHTSLMSLVPILTDPQCSHRENKKSSLPQSVSNDLEADSSTALSFTKTSTAVPSFVAMPTAETSYLPAAHI